MITLVIPFYNEEALLEKTIPYAVNYLKKEFQDYELILVDDGSRDSSLETALRYESENVKVITYSPNRGKGYAVRQGMMAARGKIIFFTDADLPYGLEGLKTGYREISEGGEIIIGSRSIGNQGYEGYPLLRKLASKIFVFTTNLVLNLDVSDSQCGFKGFSHNAAKKIFKKATIDGFSFDMEILNIAKNMGFTIKEIPVTLISHADSKINIVRDSFLMLRDLLKVRFGDKRAFFPLFLYLAMMLRFLHYGFWYFPQLDDYIQYHNYRAFGGSPSNIISNLGLLAARPLAGLADLFVWSRFWKNMIPAVFLLTLMHAVSALILSRIFQRHFHMGIIPTVIFCLIPVNFEGTYWISASSRIVTGLFFAALSAFYLQRFADKGGLKEAVLFWTFQLVSYGFYEQIIFFQLALTFLLILLNLKALGKRSLIGLASFLNVAFFFLFTGFFKDSALYKGRMELIFPNVPYYREVFLPEVLQQMKSAFLGAGGFITYRGFLRGLNIIIKEHAFFFALSTTLVSIAIAFSSLQHERHGSLKRPLSLFIAGAFLAAAPMAPFFVVGNPWISIRATAISYLGIGMMAEAVISGILPKKHLWVVAGILTFVFLTGSLAELHDYRLTTENDVDIVNTLAGTFENIDPEAKIAILNLNPTYLPEISYFYHEHIHGVTESSWALTGAFQAIAGRESVPALIPISHGFFYKDYDRLQEYDLFFLLTGDRSLVPLTPLSKTDGGFEFRDEKGILRAYVTRAPGGRGFLETVEAR